MLHRIVRVNNVNTTCTISNTNEFGGWPPAQTILTNEKTCETLEMENTVNTKQNTQNIFFTKTCSTECLTGGVGYSADYPGTVFYLFFFLLS